MPAVTRSQTRKRHAEIDLKLDIPTIDSSTTHNVLTSTPPLEYRPDYCYHYLADDAQLQRTLYNENFVYDFTEWPKDCWMKPKFAFTSFDDLFTKLQLP